MNCEKYSEWISLYIDEMLDQPDRAELENHIKDCPSCSEEVQVLREITNDLKSLEMIDLPEGFHEALMGKLTPLPISKRKWYVNLKMVSAVAAVFIFSAILIDPLKVNKSKDLMPELREGVMESRMMGPPETFSLDQATDSVEDQNLESSAGVSTFTIEPVALNEDEEIWHIMSDNYGAQKEIIISIAESLGIQLESLEETEAHELGVKSMTLKTTLSQNKKDQLSIALEQMEKIIYVPDSKESQEEIPDLVELIIVIKQIHK